MSRIPPSGHWHREPETAVCECGCLVSGHQLVTRADAVDRRSVRRRSSVPQVVTRREHCLTSGCPCRGPR